MRDAWTEAMRAADEPRAITQQRHKWAPPPMPRPHTFVTHGGGARALCIVCGVLQHGAMAKLNCGSPVNNLTGKDKAQAQEASSRG